MLDERLVTALHVQSLREKELHPEQEPHVLFQASTIGALLDGAYEGDVSFAELAEQGDLGLGTLNALDGEMIALEGRFYRADVQGAIHEVDPGTRTPFAVLTWFTPTVAVAIDRPLSHEELLAVLDDHLPDGTVACAVRVDGAFELVHARSVPRQSPPYRPLAEVVGDQRVFDLAGVEGTMVGFRFPDYSEGIEVSGYHLHFITADRTRGGTS
jgi:acetolactate decarboxylase